MDNSHVILLRRRNAALTQGELAHLLGISQSVLSRLEDNEAKELWFDIALALTVIFGEAPHRMFSRHYTHIEEQVMTRAAGMHEANRGKSDRKSLRKQALLDDMMRRATANRRDI